MNRRLGAHLRPQDPDDDSSQLLVLAPELPHLVEASLQLPVRGVDPPHHLQILLPFPLDNVPQQHLKFLVLIIPRLKNFKAGDHNLGYNLGRKLITEADLHLNALRLVFRYVNNLLFQILHKQHASTF